MHKTILALCTLAAVPILAQNPTPRLTCDDERSHNGHLVRHCEMKEQTFASSKGSIRVDPGMNGGVTVKGWDRSDVWVRARIESSAETDSEARSMVPQIRF